MFSFGFNSKLEHAGIPSTILAIFKGFFDVLTNIFVLFAESLDKHDFELQYDKDFYIFI